MFSTLAFSQQQIPNLTSVTLHKIYAVGNDGGCNSFKYMGSWPYVSKQIKDCDQMAMQLIKLKASLQSRKSNYCSCTAHCIGCANIESMITYQFNGLIDTLYFNNNKYEKKIIDYNNKKEYQDSNNEILRIIGQNKTLKEMFDTDIDSLYSKMNWPFMNLDSIKVEAITFNNKMMYGLKRKEIDTLIGGFDQYSDFQIERNPINGIESIKCFGSNYDSFSEYHFSNDFPIYKIVVKPIDDKGNYIPDTKSFYVLGINAIDDEKKIIERFPNSTKYIEEQKKYFKNNEGDYTVSVKLIDKKGYIDFTLNDSKIKQIELTFLYPDNQ